jgi:hypothetical protein
VDEVIASGGTALVVAAEPTLGRAGYWLMTVTALFATAGATNAGLYPAAGCARSWPTTGSSRPPWGAGSRIGCPPGWWSPRSRRSSSPSGST